MFCSATCSCDPRNSLVPVPCQERQLNAKGCTSSESIEWLLDLHDKRPIWSRLNEINTSGFKRKLPMSMTKNYDIEIKQRLWSLWARELKLSKSQSHSKAYMAITVMALCAARAISLNLWSSDLMNSIRVNGREFYKNILKQNNSSRRELNVKMLASECFLEGIHFNLSIRTVLQGHLYSTPSKCQLNLAYALKEFFSCYQFGLLECYDRLLGFGYIDGPSGGYFIYDAQTSSYPLFPEDVTATYLLRTNHLQVLLYCLTVTLKVSQIYHAFFCLHHVHIEIQMENVPRSVSVSTCSTVPICPLKNVKIPSDLSVKYSSSKINLKHELAKIKSLLSATALHRETRSQPKYRRKLYNFTKDDEKKNIVKHLVDADRKSDEGLQIKNDFVRMICSATSLPLMPADSAAKIKNDFACNLLDALAMGPKTCKMFQ